MPEYALVNSITSQVVKTERYASQPENLPHKNRIWLPVLRQPIPEHDNATQYVTRTTRVLPTQVVFGYAIQDRTAQEIDNAKTDHVNSVYNYAIAQLLEEINTLRVALSLPLRTETQIRTGIKDRIP